MKKEIRVVRGEYVQCTTVDERWYIKETVNAETGLPDYTYVPSVTWITDYYPKGVGYYQWLASKGWDQALAITAAAGDKGTKVHTAITDLLEGQSVRMDAQYVNPTTERPEELTAEEYRCLMTFQRWWEEAKPVLVEHDVTVWNEQEGYAGTIDLVCVIDGQLWIVDFKTGQHIWMPNKLQVSAYKAAYHFAHPHREIKLGLLQLGYQKNKKGWKWNEVEDCFELFLHTKAIWAHETAGAHPLQRSYPLTLQLPLEQAPPKAAPAAPIPKKRGRPKKEQTHASEH
jgi:hypothetical protein